MTPAKASVSRMLDFEMPIREQSVRIARRYRRPCREVIECIEQHGVRPGELVGLAQVLASPQTSARQNFFYCPVGTSPDPKSCDAFND